MTAINLVYLYLLSPLHTGGTTQEGNLLGIARESHTNLPYIPSSTIRGRLRASETDRIKKVLLFGPELEDITNRQFVEEFSSETGKELKQLEQGAIWVGDGSILWIPISSLSHGVIWISSPFLLQRWARLKGGTIANPIAIPKSYSTNLNNTNRVYLKDVILQKDNLKPWEEDYNDYIPHNQHLAIENVLVLPDRFISTVVQMSLWRQVKIKLYEYKTVDGGLRYEEAIPPDTLMYFPWGVTSQANSTNNQQVNSPDSNPNQLFRDLLAELNTIQIGGQESLGRGFAKMKMKTSSNLSAKNYVGSCLD